MWIERRTGSRGKELSPDNVYKFGKLRDERFSIAIDAAYAKGSYFIPLAEAISSLGQRQGNTQDAALAIASVPLADLIQYIDDHPSKETSDALRVCLDFPPHPQFVHYGQAAQKARDALTAIAARSPFAAFRIDKVYKIPLHAPTQSQGTTDISPDGSSFI